MSPRHLMPLLTLCCGSLLALPCEAGEIEISTTIARNLRAYAGLRVHHGRLVVDTGLLAGRTRLHGPLPSTPEQLTLEVADDLTAIRYRQATSQQEVTLRLERRREERGWEIALERRPRGFAEVTHVRFVQRPSEPLELRVGDERPLRAESLWHLWHAAPELCRDHLEPLLRLIDPELALDAEAAEIARLRGLFARRDTPAARAAWRRLVSDLGSPLPRARAAALRALEADAPATLRFLDQLDPRQLDAEQRQHVRALLAPWFAPDVDTPASVAARWRDDDEDSGDF